MRNYSESYDKSVADMRRASGIDSESMHKVFSLRVREWVKAAKAAGLNNEAIARKSNGKLTALQVKHILRAY